MGGAGQVSSAAGSIYSGVVVEASIGIPTSTTLREQPFFGSDVRNRPSPCDERKAGAEQASGIVLAKLFMTARKQQIAAYPPWRPPISSKLRVSCEAPTGSHRATGWPYK